MYETAYHTKGIEQHAFLVTGGAGFIGSNLVQYLLKYGAAKVRVLDDLSTGFYWNIQEFESHPSFSFIKGDIRDPATCRTACEGMDYVLHQAALGSVPRSIHDPVTTNSVNVTGFLNMLVAVKESGVKKMVYAASSSTYGDSKTLPKQESVIGRPLSPYAVTKYVNELYADVFARTYGTETVGLRYFNVFGPGQDADSAYAAVIPLFMKAMITGVPPRINGDGEQTRDFTFVENAVQANIKAITENRQQEKHAVYNVAGGERISLNALWYILKEITGSAVTAAYGPARQGDIRDSLADISLAGSSFQYTPLFNVKQGLAITYDWFREKMAVQTER